jgi:prevent-host-death family protein
MKSIDVSEVATHFDKLIALVESGGEVVITRRGRDVARLVAVGRPDPGRVHGAIAAIKAMRARRILGDVDIKALINRGRSA